MEEECLIIAEPLKSKIDLFSSSFNDFISNHIKLYGKRTFQIDGVSGKSQTFEEVYDKAKLVAASLQDLGVLPGDVVVVSSENRLEYSVVVLASIIVGTILAPTNTALTPDEIVYIFNISKPRVIFCSENSYRNISMSLPRLEGISYIILFDDIPSNNSVSTIRYDSLLQNKPIRKPHELKEDEIAVILNSSGTTGMPKCVMLSYANLRFSCVSFIDVSIRDIKSIDIIHGFTPFYHSFGYVIIFASIILGSKLILLPKFEERLYLSTIEKYKVTILRMSTLYMTFLSKTPMVTQYDLSSVRQIQCAASPLSSELAMKVKARLPFAIILNLYGMTESSVGITYPLLNHKDSTAVGKLFRGLQAKIVDVETGRALMRGEEGELLVRGPSIMVGYYNDPEATRETIDSEGWLHTGDIGYVDSQDLFYIVDRKKDIIKYIGHQVSPSELEFILLGMAGVKDAAVVGLPDMEVGELPIACVVLEPDTTLTDTSIMNYVNEKVSPQKWLRGVSFIESIPRNQIGKVLRRKLKAIIH